MFYGYCDHCCWIVKVSDIEEEICPNCGKELSFCYESEIDAESAKIEYVWCLHCEEVSKLEDVLNNPEGEFCRCGAGGIGFDLFPWHETKWPRDKHPDYPEIPEIGKVYSLY
jgi:hypothetical protein